MALDGLPDSADIIAAIRSIHGVFSRVQDPSRMSTMPFETVIALSDCCSPPLPIVTIDNPEPIACLSADETRDAVAEGRVIQPLPGLAPCARQAAPGEVVRIRLCRQGDEYVYVVTTLKRDGRVARVTLEGHSGKVEHHPLSARAGLPVAQPQQEMTRP